MDINYARHGSPDEMPVRHITSVIDTLRNLLLAAEAERDHWRTQAMQAQAHTMESPYD